jgi:hypothetical protein
MVESSAAITYRGRLQSHLDQNDCTCGISIEEILKFEDEYEEAQDTCFTELMQQELLADPEPEEDPAAIEPDLAGSSTAQVSSAGTPAEEHPK